MKNVQILSFSFAICQIVLCFWRLTICYLFHTDSRAILRSLSIYATHIHTHTYYIYSLQNTKIKNRYIHELQRAKQKRKRQHIEQSPNNPWIYYDFLVVSDLFHLYYISSECTQLLSPDEEICTRSQQQQQIQL